MASLTSRWLPFGIFAALLWGGCEDLAPSDSTKGSGASAPLSQREFVAAFQALACKNLSKCCDQAGFSFDASRCATLFANAGESSENRVFNPENGALCLAEMAEAPSCGQKNNAPSCNTAYRGMLPAGTSCTDSLDCAKPSKGAASCDPFRQICVVGLRGEVGDECQQSCEEGVSGSVACVWGPASGWLGDGTTVTNCFANDGLQCGDTGQCVPLAESGQACSNDSSCLRALYCDVNRGYNCQPKRSVGQSCAEYTQPCEASAYCNAGTCATRKANGQPCSTHAECAGVCNCGISGDCASSGFCSDPMDPVGSYIALLILAGQCGVTP